ncbi:bile acid:sodium symporter family protein [Ornithinimicrobium sp. Y1694]|uniref:bile acid:sodium symporter family protein n=1 Tax=Ornithinimicrobium sp. Y1694 TaxID=3418590 RepID=UPI003CEAF46F
MEQSPLIDIGLPVALAIIMVGIGLSLTRQDFAAQAKAPWASIVGTVGQLVLVPLLGIGVALLLNLPPALAIGLVLAAACPGGSTSNLVTYLARGNVALSIILTVVASLAVILTLPLWIDLAAEIVPGAAETNVEVPLAQTFGLLGGVILVPVLIGMVIKAKAPRLAVRLERYVGLVGIVVLVALIVGIVMGLRDRIGELLLASGPAVLLLNVLAILLGGALAYVCRLPRADQIAIAVEFGIKNSTLGMLIAFTVIRNDEIALPSAVYGLVMYLTAFALVWGGRRLMGPAAQDPVT